MCSNDIESLLPHGFKSDLYHSIKQSLNAITSHNNDPKTIFFRGAFNSVAYRYVACCEFSDSYASLFRKHSAFPKLIKHRYCQERDLFCFFSNGLSAIETLFYAMYSTASQIKPDSFPMDTEKDLRAITPLTTYCKYHNAFPEDKLTAEMHNLIICQKDKYEIFLTYRNTLTHRFTPGRTYNMGGELDGTTNWFEKPLDVNLISDYLTWLTGILNKLIVEFHCFIIKNEAALK